jgi:uncharacterized protein
MRPEMRRIALAVVAVLIVLVLIFATISILFPPVDSRFVGIPTIYPYANDNAGALEIGDKEWIDSICLEIDQETSCEVAVLVVNTTQPNDISYFTLRTFQKNAIGKEGRDNGVLILVAVDDDAWKIEVGYGLMGILTGARVTDLANEFLVPEMTDIGSLGFGLVDLTTAIGNILVDEYTGSAGGNPAYPIQGIPLESWQWILLIGVIILIIVATRGRALVFIFWIFQGLGRGGGKWGGGRSGGGGGRG